MATFTNPEKTQLRLWGEYSERNGDDTDIAEDELGWYVIEGYDPTEVTKLWREGRFNQHIKTVWEDTLALIMTLADDKIEGTIREITGLIEKRKKWEGWSK